MANFGDVVRQLMERKGVTGVQLAQDIGISKPRQLTLTHIMQRLCATPQEDQLILSAFAGTTKSAGGQLIAVAELTAWLAELKEGEE